MNWTIMNGDSKTNLRIEEIQKTIERLIFRISDRFSPFEFIEGLPDTLRDIQRNQSHRPVDIAPIYLLRLFVYGLMLLLGLLLVLSIQQLHLNLN
jgi:hypothetical protein